jgi:scyllo-inositol 2-dehydrogenase (NADP+)
MIGIGIVGIGKMGAFHAEWIAKSRELKLVAVCDKSAQRVDEFKARYGAAGYTDYDSFLSAPGMEWVAVITTNDVHEALCVKALEKKKNVIVEKPMSLNHESTLRMIAAAEKNGRTILVHHSSRWDRDFLLVQDVIRSGTIGDLLMIQSRVMLCDEGWPAWGIEGMANPWRIKAQYGGGILLDWGPHLVDQFLVLMGKDPVSVYGRLQSGVWSSEVDDYFFADLRFEGKTICQMEVGNNARITAPRWYVIGTRGTLEVKGKSDPVWDEAEIRFVRADGKKEIQRIQMTGVCESGLEGGFYADLPGFLSGQKKPFATMHEAAKTVKILDLIRQSSTDGRSVAWRAQP